LHLQLQQSLETFRYAYNLLTQFAGFLIAADALLIGYGLSQRISSVFLFGALIPAAIGLAMSQFVLHVLPIWYVGMLTESRLEMSNDGLVGLYVRTHYAEVAALIDKELKEQGRHPALLEKSVSWRSTLSGNRVFLVLMAILGHIVFFVVSTVAYGYRFM
jgi:hypothetical protein